jgi:ParB-like partition proteins
MQKIISISPFRCRVWTAHDRLEECISEKSCKLEIESFAEHGQLVPVLGRSLRGDPMYEVELIYGARRLFVARHLNIPLKVEIRELSDREAIIAMDIENRQRQNISPYERGLSFTRWLREGYFTSQDEVAHALNISASQVSRLLKMTKLPSVIVGAFENPSDIREGWGLDLVDAWEDPGRRRLIADRARAMTKRHPRPSAAKVYEELISEPRASIKHRHHYPEEIVRDATGTPLFRIRHERRVVAVMLPVKTLSSDTLKKISSQVANILQNESLQRFDLSSIVGAGNVVNVNDSAVAT